LTAATASLSGIAIAAQSDVVPSGAVTSTMGVLMRAIGPDLCALKLIRAPLTAKQRLTECPRDNVDETVFHTNEVSLKHWASIEDSLGAEIFGDQ
jgi:hypothetical protein